VVALAAESSPARVNAPLRIATRASEVALRRARVVQAMFAARGIGSTLITVRTSGDRHFEDVLSPAAARTVFSRDLEAMLLKKADVAVHALADLEPELAAGTHVAAVLPRGDARDVLVLNGLIEATSLGDLPRGTRIGTSCVRRRSLLLAQYPDIEVVHLRGDLRTRLHKVDDGQVHGAIESADALQQLEVSQRVAAHLDPPDWLPAAGQGAVALQIRAGDAATAALVAPLDDARTRCDTTAERALLGSLEGGRQSPIGALVVSRDGIRTLHASIGDLRGRQIIRMEREMDDAQPALVGVRLANDLRAQGASRILDEVRGSDRIAAPQPDS
jgi:hydroxymethylbilane synthase